MSLTMQPVCSDRPPFGLSEKHVVELADDLVAYHQHFAGLLFRKEQRRWALKYLQGLLLPSEGKCIEKVALSVEDAKVRPMQRFVG